MSAQIDLLPGAPLHTSHLYRLSKPEWETYITLHEHETHAHLVLQCILENWVYIKSEKCEFHAESASFPGFIVENGQLKADSKNQSSF